MTNGKFGKQKTHKRRRLEHDNNVTPFPLRHKSVAERREDEDRCPDCGAERACYSCASQGGWLSQKEHDEFERELTP